MTQEQILAFAVIGLTVIFFIWDRWRYDVVALGSLFAAVVVGVVPADKAFEGFSNPVVITVACILVISASISRSGFIDLALKILSRFTEMPKMQIVVLAGMVMTLSAFMNNIGALAIFLPIALSFARKADRKPSEMLMPLSFASLLGGLITLIGTPPNLLISNVREDFTGSPYSMFDFAPVGIALCLASLAYLSVGWRLLPKDRRGQPLPEDRFAIEDYISDVIVDEDSLLIGKTIRDAESSLEGDISIVGFIRYNQKNLAPSGRTKIKAGDVLLIETDPMTLKNLVDSTKVRLAGNSTESRALQGSDEIGIVEAVVTANSEMIGFIIKQLELRRRFGINILAVRQSDRRNLNSLGNIRLRAGDIVVIQGSLDSMSQTLQQIGCLPLAERNLQLGRPKFVFMPPLIMFAAVSMAVFDILPISIAFLGGVLAIAVMKIMKLKDIYEAIDWPIIILLGALIPVTEAVQNTGGAELLANGIAVMTAGLSPMVVLGMVMTATMIVTPFLNNAATVLLMAPIAGNLAGQMGLSVDPFLMAVAVGASCDFLTPIGHQSNTLVMGPGGYKFTDYWRMGLPLTIMIIVLGTPLIMAVWPIHP